MTIDELEGEELAADVAVAQGLKYWKDFEVTPVAWWAKADGTAFCTVAKYRPDRDIAQAWELVEEMRSTDWIISLHSGRECWRATFRKRQSMDYDRVSGDTAPIAICRAFLKAKAATK